MITNLHITIILLLFFVISSILGFLLFLIINKVRESQKTLITDIESKEQIRYAQVIKVQESQDKLMDLFNNNVYIDLLALTSRNLRSMPNISKKDKQFRVFMFNAVDNIHKIYKKIKITGDKLFENPEISRQIIEGSVDVLDNFEEVFIDKIKVVNTDAFTMFLQLYNLSINNGEDRFMSLKTHLLTVYETAVERIVKLYKEYYVKNVKIVTEIDLPGDVISYKTIQITDTNKLKILIAQGKLKEVFEYFYTIQDSFSEYNEIMQLSAAYSIFMRNDSLGLEVQQKELNRITKAMLDIIDKLK